jgi:hypothetical protein
MTQHKADAEHSPLLLLGAFALVAVILFSLFKLAGPGEAGATSAEDDSVASTPASSGPSPTLPPTRKGETISPQDVQDVPKLDKNLRPGRIEHNLTPDFKPSTGRTGTGFVLGELPDDINAPPSTEITGTVTTAAANIPNRTSDAGFVSSMHAIIGAQPDFITLNEVSRHSTAGIAGAAPGYSVYRDPVIDSSLGGGSRAFNDVVLWKSSVWTQYDGGRVKVVNDDNCIFKGQAETWDRYATWVTLQRADGAVISVISTHMPTNPAKVPQQHGYNPMTRAEQYGHGMDIIRGLIDRLQAVGPVIVQGDMNSHPTDGSWAAAPKLTPLGYGYTKDNGVMYTFYPTPTSMTSTRYSRIVSDHPALFTTIDMNGAGPAA